MKIKPTKINNSLRAQFLKNFFKELDRLQISYAIIRSYSSIFQDHKKDIDFLISPSHFKKVSKIFKDSLKELNGTLVSSSLANKNLYLKAFFVDDQKHNDDIKIESLYLHFVPFITLKQSSRTKDIKFFGKKIFIDNIRIESIIIEGCSVKIPSKKFQVLFLLSKMIFKPNKKYCDDLKSITEDRKLNEWFLDLKIANYIQKFTLGSIELEDICLTINIISNSLFKNSKYFLLCQYSILVYLNFIFFFKFSGRLIFFSGPDGSGKTTANNALSETLRRELKCSVINYKHLYPISTYFSKNIMTAQSRIRDIHIDDSFALERDRGSSFTWRFRRILGLIFLLLQILPGFLYGKYLNWKGHHVIVDTSFFDAFIKGHRPSFPYLQLLTIPLIPSGNLWFLMRSTPYIIKNRKPELNEAEIQMYYQFFENLPLFKKNKIIEINSSSGINNALALIIKNFDI